MFKGFATGIVYIMQAVGSLPLTFWGVIILFASMYIATHYNMAIGYYFAGVGSTMVGITKLQQLQNTTATMDANKSEMKVETNASNPTSQG